ncbi:MULTISPECIES: molybdate ABC transporter substrate-binding protein [Vibrio]|jgi:molybdate transport system substrate-binding protein|uniref:molybdate ABC transporter substrate-binding protein n=1 Tax=Vibrio TaxID=662 RepID=UPI00028E3B22|nr:MULTISPECIES: molybdate ABC transporter substrate-binding protein [Vibrio]APP07747.1 molybdate ABC transporter substrate-binding protein [Vibrio harveyi]EKM20538.1 molybdate ABC transporter, periplasmic molybdate-binding protein [Vibrio harveyi]EKO3782317.1 molybdate ABC transporter substrate-binding protein [Vibrio harveyi]EKO3803310.1 molybdate ABC transporter substrate-binding protein [Vibrio harveyi]EKO3816737.1 molybdate ABC transporter substrate-binding protein [Vibrio harveyi]
MKAWKIHACLVAILSVSSAANAATELKVYAASSMTNAVNDIAQQFETKYDVTVTPVYGGSSSIARQILNGAPADIFISANTKWMDYLVKSKAVKNDSVTNLVRNSLVLIAPKASTIEPFDFSDANAWNQALEGNRLALGNPVSVPAGMYAKESLTNLGVWKKLERQIAPAKNVRLALALVERGEAPLGVVYKTDALLTDKVKVVGEFANDTHADIIYPAAIVKDSTQSEQFFEYLKSDDAKKVFAQYGFQ